MKLKRKHKLWAGLCVSVLLLSYFAITFVRQEKRMHTVGAENAALQQQLETLQLQQATLESDLENASSAAYIERVAREELGFVKQGEIKFTEADGE